jgi:mRNA-degrading endonuclease toxin of MazEF toxin-antitoxin module
MPRWEETRLPARPTIGVVGARFGQVWTIRGAAAAASFAIVSDDGWNDEYPTVFVIELERVTRPRARPGRSVVDRPSGTVALVDRLATVHESMLAEHIGGLTRDQMECIADAMREIPLDYCIRGGARPVVAAA